MAFLIDGFLDSMDAYDGTGCRVDITSQEATTYSEATTGGTYSLGNKTGLTFTAITNASPDGRQISTPAITDGTVSNNGTATHWAITDGASVLIATGALSASQAVTSGNTFTLDAINLIHRDATAV